MVQLSVIIVNTNEEHVLRPCLRSLYEQVRDIDVEVIVVDNASTDQSVPMLRQNYPQVRILLNERNLGFAAANNVGIRKATGNYVLLLNPDTEILNGAIQKTVRFMEDHPTVGIAGCRLRYPSGRVQPSVRSFPSLSNLFYESTFLYRVFPRSKAIGRYYMSYFDYQSDLEVDWVCGAFFMIRRSVIEQVGILDERFYMYTEEVDYCFRARKAGYHIWFFAGAEIVHHWGGPNVSNKRLVYWGHRSQLLFLRKHFAGIERIGCEALKYFGVLVRIFVYLAGGLVLFNRRLVWKAYSYTYALLKLSAELAFPPHALW